MGNNMLSIFKKNSMWLGMALALISPIIMYYLLSLIIGELSERLTHGIPLIKDHNLLLISVFLNMLVFTSYLHKAPYDKTGKGVMIVTFILTAIYFVWRYKDLII